MLKFNFINKIKLEKKKNFHLKKNFQNFLMKKKIKKTNRRITKNIEFIVKRSYTPINVARKRKAGLYIFFSFLNFNKRRFKIKHTDYFFTLYTFFYKKKIKISKIPFNKNNNYFLFLNIFFYTC